MLRMSLFGLSNLHIQPERYAQYFLKQMRRILAAQENTS
jgi:hypothetical protein